MNVAITETNRRRKIQEEYNRKHNVKPKSIIKEITNIVTVSMAAENSEIYKTDTKSVSTEQMHEIIVNLEKEMISAAEVLDFEKAANLRDQIRKLKKEYGI